MKMETKREGRVSYPYIRQNQLYIENCNKRQKRSLKMIKWSCHREDKSIINTYLPNIRAHKYKNKY